MSGEKDTAGVLHRPVSRLLDLAFPPSCAGCGREGQAICDGCATRLRVRQEVPPGIPIGLPSEIPRPLVQLEWCAPFNGLVRAALHQLKYAGEARLAEPLGVAVAERWRAAGRGAEVVVPVPVHAERARERGYDQAVLLACVVGRELGLPVHRALVRDRATRPQFALGHAARAANVAGAFAVAEPAAARMLGGRWILLVDDVVTTGATLGACAEALGRSGARAVSAATVARER